MKPTVLGTVTICAGALLALVVGTATASADTTPPSTEAHATEQTADGGLAISLGGISLLQTGNNEAFTYGPNLAIAYNNSQAGAIGGFGNVAIAGNNSYSAAAGILNTAIADNKQRRECGLHRYRKHRHRAKRQLAGSYDGNFNTVRATNNSSAQIYIGSFNTVTATDRSTAILSGDANRVTARCGGSVEFSAQGQIVTNAPCEAG